MTLIAGVRCRDGYIIASDTAVTVGTSVFQGKKIDHYVSRSGDPYRIIVAWSGGMALGKMASQKIRDAVEGLPDRSLLKMKRAVEEVVRSLYIEHIGAVYLQFPGRVEVPTFNLIVALEARDGYGIVATDESATFEIDQLAFRGSGQELAGFLAERLLVNPQTMYVHYSTPAAVHIVKHMFAAAKKSAAAVGGHTEIYARLMYLNKGKPYRDDFFTMHAEQDLDSEILWSLDEKLADALSIALDPTSSEAHALDKVTKSIHETLEKVRSSAQRGRKTDWGERNRRPRLMHLTQRDDGKWGAAFDDHYEP